MSDSPYDLNNAPGFAGKRKPSGAVDRSYHLAVVETKDKRIADLQQQLAEAQKHLAKVLSKRGMVFHLDADWLAAEKYAKDAAIDRAQGGGEE